MEGTEQFLAAAGFQLQLIPNAEQHTENYWIFSKDTPDSIEYLTVIFPIIFHDFESVIMSNR